MAVFGTRPELIKLAPVLHELVRFPDTYATITVNTGQHAHLLQPFLRQFQVRVDRDLNVMRPGQAPSQVCARVLTALDPILDQERPDLVLVQGDTTTALAGALAAFHRRIPVGHVEAGLRSGNTVSPFPEEMNRRLITRLASVHFAATPGNRATLIVEGVDPATIFVTGNPVVDALQTILGQLIVSPALKPILRSLNGSRYIVLTTHRRESFGAIMAGYLRALRDFVARHEDIALLFPVHPNPAVRSVADSLLAGRPRIHLLEPLGYTDFISLLAQAWLIVSDSGGVQEEAPSLGKPLIVLRENTERPEAVASGVARLVGGDPAQLDTLLETTYLDPSWAHAVQRVENPFGRGNSGARIVQAISVVLGIE